MKIGKEMELKEAVEVARQTANQKVGIGSFVKKLEWIHN
jgi:hypothetical protein